MEMKIQVDGMTKEVPDDSTLEEILQTLGEPVSHVLVELNGVYVRPSDYSTFKIKAGDSLEVILPAHGG
jgi:thiamine biosynthesis protein ThiS